MNRRLDSRTRRQRLGSVVTRIWLSLFSVVWPVSAAAPAPGGGAAALASLRTALAPPEATDAAAPIGDFVHFGAWIRDRSRGRSALSPDPGRTLVAWSDLAEWLRRGLSLCSSAEVRVSRVEFDLEVVVLTDSGRAVSTVQCLIDGLRAAESRFAGEPRSAESGRLERRLDAEFFWFGPGENPEALSRLERERSRRWVERDGGGEVDGSARTRSQTRLRWVENDSELCRVEVEWRADRRVLRRRVEETELDALRALLGDDPALAPWVAALRRAGWSSQVRSELLRDAGGLWGVHRFTTPCRAVGKAVALVLDQIQEGRVVRRENVERVWLHRRRQVTAGPLGLDPLAARSLAARDRLSGRRRVDAATVAPAGQQPGSVRDGTEARPSVRALRRLLRRATQDLEVRVLGAVGRESSGSLRGRDRRRFDRVSITGG